MARSRRSSATPSPLVGQSVLITGAARGIGAALARRAAARGARVALVGLEPELLVQQPPPRAVDLERVCLAAAAIEGQHQLAAQTLADVG